MPKVIAHSLVGSVLIVASMIYATCNVRSQETTTSVTDTGYALSKDSVQRLDSAYRARKALLDRWVHTQQATAHPQEDFISVSVGYGGYVRILPRDLNQLFSERTLRADPASDRNQYSTIDRAITAGVQAQLARTWGIYFEYDLVEKWFNTTIDGTTPPAGATEELDLTEHSFVVGGMYIFYSGRFYRLRVNGGFGAVMAFTTETESVGSYSRAASAMGYQINFDVVNDFRVMPDLSFTLDLLARTVTTAELKTPGGQTLDASFGAGNPSRITLQPRASNAAYGIAAGLVYYF